MVARYKSYAQIEQERENKRIDEVLYKMSMEVHGKAIVDGQTSSDEYEHEYPHHHGPEPGEIEMEWIEDEDIALIL